MTGPVLDGPTSSTQSQILPLLLVTLFLELRRTGLHRALSRTFVGVLFSVFGIIETVLVLSIDGMLYQFQWGDLLSALAIFTRTPRRDRTEVEARRRSRGRRSLSLPEVLGDVALPGVDGPVRVADIRVPHHRVDPQLPACTGGSPGHQRQGPEGLSSGQPGQLPSGTGPGLDSRRQLDVFALVMVTPFRCTVAPDPLATDVSRTRCAVVRSRYCVEQTVTSLRVQARDTRSGARADR
ncbi:hypothetical protein ACVWWN_002892 [Mycobacterium sp. URHB0021]|jgi:hypothetical protein